MTTQIINEHSTDEQIEAAMCEDGYLNAQGGFDWVDGIGDFEAVCNWIRANAETGSLVWTAQHIVGTRSAYRFSMVPGAVGTSNDSRST